MTNAQMAHKMGIDKVAAPATAYRDALTRSGLIVVNDDIGVCGSLTGYEAKAWTRCGWLSILCGENGTARIDKPNGTHKWVYEKTPAQIAALLRQTLAFYK